ncbi:phage portal protein [Saccharothrix sp. NPDC042600]|uniref:phage portal protein n=1 Tax=Saccharothrix sp. NPDC042600 TaxID=3154492 RepID=UPI0033C55FE4
MRALGVPLALQKFDAADIGRRLVERWPDQARNDKIHRYVKGDHDLPFAPRASKAHYLWTLRKSRTNWCRLLVQLLAQNLFVDGIRAAGQTEGDASPWRFWTLNRMARRQSAIHRAALKYGHAFASVLPGDTGPAIRGHSPRTMSAFYADESDEWPVYAVERAKSWTPSGPRTLYRLYDDTSVYFLGAEGDGSLSYVEHRDHNAGVTPIVRFVDEDDLDSDTPGVVEPVLDIQDRLNYSTFLLLMAGEHGAHRQRWAAGLELDEGEEPPIGPDRLLHSDSPDTKFGSFDATPLSGYVEVLEQVLRHLAAITQTPPHALLGSLTNLSADALAAAESGLQRRVGERRTSYGESWEQVLRLCSLLAGDLAGWLDTTAQVRWRDTETRSLAAVVDAWGKAVTMLGVPQRATWERLPGVTDTDVARWAEMPVTPDGAGLLADVLARAADPAS